LPLVLPDDQAWREATHPMGKDRVGRRDPAMGEDLRLPSKLAG